MFYQHITVTVTGNVVTDLEFIHTLKVRKKKRGVKCSCIIMKGD